MLRRCYYGHTMSLSGVPRWYVVGRQAGNRPDPAGCEVIMEGERSGRPSCRWSADSCRCHVFLHPLEIFQNVKRQRRGCAGKSLYVMPERVC